jgi:hypothetical protein
MVLWPAAGVAAALVELERLADAQQRAQALCRSGGGKRIATSEEVLSVFARANTHLGKGRIILPLPRRHHVDEVQWTDLHTCGSRMSTAGGRMWTSLHRTHLHEMWKFAPRGQFSTACGLRPQRASVSRGENQPSGKGGKLFEADFLQTHS